MLNFMPKRKKIEELQAVDKVLQISVLRKVTKTSVSEDSSRVH